MSGKPKSIRIRRIYEEPSSQDGVRVLVDRLWPRGVSKEKAALDAWMKDLAPSDELRRKFHGHPERWDDFVRSYKQELKDKADLLEELKALASGKRLTLLFASKNTEHNNAVVLEQVLEPRAAAN